MPSVYYDAITTIYFLLLYHLFTTYTLDYTLPTYLDYNLKIIWSSLPNHKPYLHKNLNICLFYLRNNINVIMGKGRDIVWSMNPLH